MALTTEEQNFIKELYKEKIKQDQIKILQKSMWEKVNILKANKKSDKWKKIAEEKQKCREQINQL